IQRIHADSVRLAFDVKSAYVLALHAQDRRSVTQRITEVFREATRTASERYEAGDISRYARSRIRVERARYETLLADADMEVGSAQRTLALLVAPGGEDIRLAAAPLPTPTPPPIPSRVFDLAVVEERAELASARAEVDAEVARARLMRAERVPDLTASGGFKRQSDGLRGVFLGLSIPVPFFDRGAGAVQAADAGLLAAEERLMLTRRQLQNDVLQAVESFETLQRRSQLLSGEAMGEADDLLDIALVAYEEGEMELLELLDAAAALHGARTAESGLQTALWTAYYDLERAVGGFDDASAQSTTDPEIR
ncbi:MAG: TolC family protein, partial [Gemmatimonadota bacterium]|nr:TolC family protein [Gemmatimonadota bacterium]